MPAATSSDHASAIPLSLLDHPIARAALPFINGGLSGMAATTIIQPIDMIKVRIQLAGEGTGAGVAALKPTPLSVTRSIIAGGNVLDLYSGLSAGLLRQAVYTTARMGFFGTFMNHFNTKAKAEGRAVTFSERAIASLSAGGLGAIMGNPADLALIRMQSDGLRPVAQRSNYTSVINALSRISKAEGVTALWNGSLPTVARAMALNFGQLAFFSEAKSQLKRFDGTLSAGTQVFAASAIAGFFASFFSLPFDFVKTRLQKQGSEQHYKGAFDCVRKVIKEEGIGRFYRGFGTYYVRIAPHAMLTVLFADMLASYTLRK
ncbi:putative mitochondrial dicarboxylate carrier protein [Peziza echinospora]|nr:putative mitochondrial dicarboxylate carrier protein [Peziza echinospora]